MPLCCGFSHSHEILGPKERAQAHTDPRERVGPAFLPVDEGTLVIYINHTSTDQVAGLGGGAKRRIGRSVMAGQLKGVFETTRAGLGR